MADPETIYNWRRLDDRITTSGQPTEPQLADIHALGVRHVINLGLHTHEKALPDEAASVSRLGMTYIHIPVDFQDPTEQDFEQFCSMMEQLKELPVHVHCIANYRVSAFFYRYRRDVLGTEETHTALSNSASSMPSCSALSVRRTSPITSRYGACAWPSASGSISTPTYARPGSCPASPARCAMSPARSWTG